MGHSSRATGRLGGVGSPSPDDEDEDDDETDEEQQSGGRQGALVQQLDQTGEEIFADVSEDDPAALMLAERRLV